MERSRDILESKIMEFLKVAVKYSKFYFKYILYHTLNTDSFNEYSPQFQLLVTKKYAIYSSLNFSNYLSKLKLYKFHLRNSSSPQRLLIVSLSLSLALFLFLFLKLSVICCFTASLTIFLHPLERSPIVTVRGIVYRILPMNYINEISNKTSNLIISIAKILTDFELT